MSDQPDPTSDPTNDQPMRLTVRDAATRLGLSQNAVRQKVKRGSLRAERVAGVVYVLVGDQPARDPLATNATNANDQRPTQPDPSDQRDDLVVLLQADVAFLRAELASRREAERELRVLLAQMTVQAQALPANVAGADDDAQLRAERDALRLRVAALEADQTAATTLGQDVAPRAEKRAWWRFWTP